MNRSFTLKLAERWIAKRFPDLSDYIHTIENYRIIVMIEKHFSGGWKAFVNNLHLADKGGI